MAENDLSARPSINTTDFKAGIAQMNRDIRLLEAEFRASAAVMGDWGKDADGLTMRVESLNRQIDVQEQKVTALRGEWEKSRDTLGDNAITTQKLQEQYLKAAEALGKMQSELRQTEGALNETEKESDEAGNEIKELGDKEEVTARQTKALDGAMKGLATAAKVGVAAIAAVGAAAIAAVAGLAKMTSNAIDMAGELVDMSLKTGISVERLQELAYVGEQVGTSADTIQGSLAKLTRARSSAQDETSDYNKALQAAKAAGKEFTGELGPAAAAFKQLGVAVTDSNGNLRDNETVMFEALAALGRVGNETERDALALQIFGRSALELNPLIKTSADEFKRLAEEGRAMGAVVGEENVLALEAMGDQLAGLKMGLTGVAATLASAFMPGLQDATGAMKGYLGQLSEVVSGSDNLEGMTAGIGEIFGNIATDIAASLPQILQAGLGVVQGLLTAITQAAPQLAQAAVEIVTGLATFIIQNLPMLVKAGITMALALIKGLAKALPDLIKGVAGALKEIITAVAEALPELIVTIAEAIPEILTAIIEAIPELIEAGIELLLALVDGLLQALPILIAALPRVIQALIDGLLKALPLIINAAIQLLLALVNGLLQAIPVLVQAAPKIIMALIQGILQALPLLIQALPQIITAIITAITTALPLLVEAAVEIIIAIIDGLAQAIPLLIEYIPELVVAIVTALIQAAPALWEAAVKIVTTLVDGIKRLLPKIQQGARDIITAFVKKIKELDSSIRNVGRDIVQGVWKGIQNAAAWFTAKVRKFFTDIVNNIMNALKAHSPSEVFADIGESMVQGLGVGWSRSFKTVQDDVKRMMAGLGDFAINVNGLTPEFAGAGAGVAGPTNINVTLSGFVFQGEMSEAAQGAMLEQMRRISEIGVTEALRSLEGGRRQRW